MHTEPAGIVSKHFEKVTDPQVYRGPKHYLVRVRKMGLGAN